MFEFIPFSIITTIQLLSGMGIIMGLTHAFEADHFSSIYSQLGFKGGRNSNFTILQNIFSSSSKTSLFWGMGHLTSISILGISFHIFSINIQDYLFFDIGLIPAIALVVIGFLIIFNHKSIMHHDHWHHHSDGTYHTHDHIHIKKFHHHSHKPFLIGLIHGLAGTGTIIAAFGANIEQFSELFWFIGFFGIGSICGMFVISSLIGVPLQIFRNFKNFAKVFRYVGGSFSIIFGVVMIFQNIFTLFQI